MESDCSSVSPYSCESEDELEEQAVLSGPDRTALVMDGGAPDLELTRLQSEHELSMMTLRHAKEVKQVRAQAEPLAEICIGCLT